MHEAELLLLVLVDRHDVDEDAMRIRKLVTRTRVCSDRVGTWE